MKKLDLEEKFVLVELKNCCGFLKLYEKKQLTEDEYHPISTEKQEIYYTFVKTRKRVGQLLGNAFIPPEPYQTYRTKKVYFHKVNDDNLDGFAYDKKNGVVVYGEIRGIYAVEKKGKYYDAITGEVIPNEIIGYHIELSTVDNLDRMIQDLRFIEKHKDVYIQITEERYRKLKEGEENRRIAIKKYQEKYEQFIKRTRTGIAKDFQEYEQLLKEQKPKIASKTAQIKQLIYQIRNND